MRRRFVAERRTSLISIRNSRFLDALRSAETLGHPLRCSRQRRFSAQTIRNGNQISPLRLSCRYSLCRFSGLRCATLNSPFTLSQQGLSSAYKLLWYHPSDGSNCALSLRTISTIETSHAKAVNLRKEAVIPSFLALYPLHSITPSLRALWPTNRIQI